VTPIVHFRRTFKPASHLLISFGHAGDNDKGHQCCQADDQEAKLDVWIQSLRHDACENCSQDGTTVTPEKNVAHHLAKNDNNDFLKVHG
jgi:hypothetical protein